MRGGADLEVVGGPGEHAFLAVEGVLGPHEDEGGGLQVLIVVSGCRSSARTGAKAEMPHGRLPQ